MKEIEYGVQLYTCNSRYNSTPCKEKFESVKNAPRLFKPYGGFWTSSYMNENLGSAWVQTNLEHNSIFVPSSKLWTSYLLYPSSHAKIYTIDSYYDLENLMKKFRQLFRFHNTSGLKEKLYTLNFEKLSQYYDAIHLTQKGMSETANSYPLHLKTWDLESTLWFNFDYFDKIEYIGDINYILENGVI